MKVEASELGSEFVCSPGERTFASRLYSATLSLSLSSLLPFSSATKLLLAGDSAATYASNSACPFRIARQKVSHLLGTNLTTRETTVSEQERQLAITSGASILIELFVTI